MGDAHLSLFVGFVDLHGRKRNPAICVARGGVACRGQSPIAVAVPVLGVIWLRSAGLVAARVPWMYMSRVSAAAKVNCQLRVPGKQVRLYTLVWVLDSWR